MQKSILRRSTERLIIAFLIIGPCYFLFLRHEFDNNYSFCIGRVTEITPPGWKSSGDYSVLYTFEINNKTYSNNVNLNFCLRGLTIADIRSLILNKRFAIAYDTKPPWSNLMILTPSSAERFKYDPGYLHFWCTLLNSIAKTICRF